MKLKKVLITLFFLVIAIGAIILCSQFFISKNLNENIAVLERNIKVLSTIEVQKDSVELLYSKCTQLSDYVADIILDEKFDLDDISLILRNLSQMKNERDHFKVSYQRILNEYQKYLGKYEPLKIKNQSLQEQINVLKLQLSALSKKTNSDSLKVKNSY